MIGVTGLSDVAVTPGIVLVGTGGVKVTVGKSDEIGVDVGGRVGNVPVGSVGTIDGVVGTVKMPLVNTGGVSV